MTASYPNTKLYIAGKWVDAIEGETIDVMNPVTGKPIGNVAHARIADLDHAIDAAQSGFKVWKETSAYNRYKIMRNAAINLRDRIDKSPLPPATKLYFKDLLTKAEKNEYKSEKNKLEYNKRHMKEVVKALNGSH